MSKPVSIEEMASSIRTIYSSDAPQAEKAIEQYLEDKLEKFSQSERVEVLERLAGKFKTATTDASPVDVPDSEVLSRLLSLFLGERISEVDLNSPDLSARLARCLNTIFDCVNEIITVMNATLLGKEAEAVTIRHIIGTNLEDESGAGSMEAHLDQIKKAFLTSHQAFKEAVRNKVGAILRELDPDRIAEIGGGGLKFGPLKKAGDFDLYREKFQRVQNWFRSERFTEDLLREFEKICQRTYRV